jgi:hypothetical protein
MVNLTIFYNFENKYEFFVFSSENHVFNEIHMNVKIDKWQFVKLRRTFFFSIATSYLVFVDIFKTYNKSKYIFMTFE